MTEMKAWSKIRVINYLLQNIDEAMGERDVKTSLKYTLMGIQEEGFIPSFEIIEKGDLLRIDVPGMFFLEIDPNREATAIHHADHGYVEVQMDAGAYARESYMQTERENRRRRRKEDDTNIRIFIGNAP